VLQHDRIECVSSSSMIPFKLFHPAKYLLVSCCAVFTYWFSTVTMAARTRLGVTLYVHCLSFLIYRSIHKHLSKPNALTYIWGLSLPGMLMRRRLVVGMWRNQNVIYACALCSFRRAVKLYAIDIWCRIYQWHLLLPRIVERWREAHNIVSG